MYSRSSEEKRKSLQLSRKSRRQQRKNSSHEAHEMQHQLQDALRHGLAVENMLWSSKMTDWIVGLHAADIDGDGDIEIVVASRDGWITVFTRFGSFKWEHQLEEGYPTTLTAIPLRTDVQEQKVCIILGLRSGKVIALDKDGMQLRDWGYDASQVVRQVSIGANSSDAIVLGSEDRYVHVLDLVTGKLRWKYRTDGWVRCVFVCDIDGDGQDEIIAGSDDKSLYIFNIRGQLLYSFDTGYWVYALHVANLKTAGPMHILMSSNRKDLMAWQVTRLNMNEWKHELVWLRSSEDEERLFANRLHSICAQDINKDGTSEILVGSEDGHLVVLDHQGQLLWKQNFQSCIYNVSALDINYDGLLEVLVGTEDNSVYVLQLELGEQLPARIRKLYNGITHFYGWKTISEGLALRERALLKDFVDEPLPRPRRMELAEAKSLMQEQRYEEALAIILRLVYQKVQYCWSQPFTTQGYIWSGYFSNLTGGENDELLVGTDQGYIYALDVSQDQGVPIWSKSFSEQTSDRVRMVCPGPTMPDQAKTTLVVLANSRIVLLDNNGQLLRDRILEEGQGWVAHLHTGDGSAPDEVILGLEDHRIAFWDGNLSLRTGQFETVQGTGAVYAYDLFGNGTIQIISGALKNGVYAYTRDGQMLWSFDTQDRVETLYVTDIDRDGYPEIIVGSEDRNVYLLDHEGHLRWRYRTLRGPLDIDICDIKMGEDSDDPRERPLKILVSGKANYLYMLDASGDLVWQYRCPDRVRMVRARDVNNDGNYEIALTSEDQLELLQILKRDELGSLRNECWSKLAADYEDRSVVRRLCEHPDEYIRGTALAVLAGIDHHDEEDFRYLQRALKEDGSLHVKLELVRAIINLCEISKNDDPKKHERNVHWARQLLEGLYHAPEVEIRMRIVDILPVLDEGLFSEYLERSTDYADIWVRRAVVRRLDMLVEKHPELVLRLLLKTVRDEEEWVRQESGRVLAHYFDTHIMHLVHDLFALLDQTTDVVVFRQIAYSTRYPALKGLFFSILRQLTEVRTENLPEILSSTIHDISTLNRLGVFYGEELLQTYEEFRQILHAKNISSIAGYQRVTRSENLLETPLARSGLTVSVLDAFEEAARVVATYERRQTVGERVSSLIEAQHVLEKVRGDLRQSIQPLSSSGHQRTSLLPEGHILMLLLEQWSAVISTELARMRGSAHLVLALGSTTVPRAAEAVVSLRMRNDGQCSADNVCVELEDSPDFEIVGARRHKLAEVSTKFPASVEFVLRLRKDSARLIFHLTYDDAEKRGKNQVFADEVGVYEYRRSYHIISNPYTTGTPIREKDMFYGRKEDLLFLRESLGSLSANRVVLLWGQRRMGKTSLIYQLANELALGRYAPVFIDLQDLALKDSPSQLLESFAQCIYKEVLFYKNVRITEPVHEKFVGDSSTAFRDYLSSVWEWLPDHRLILLIDEFDGMRQYVERDGESILHYLRSLMQHYPGLNVLLSGAPLMPYTEGYHSVFFNIAQSRKLGKLKPEEARELITEPIHNDLEYDSLALEKMLSLTNGWPYFIHVMSEKLIEHCNLIQKPYVTIAEVNRTLELVLNEQSSSIRWIWQDLTSPIEKLVLALLAQEKGEEGRIFSLNDIQRDFDAYGVQYTHQDVIEALRRLTQGDFIEEAFDGVQYRIPVGLLKSWLRKDKPPERVVREEKFFEDDL
jgi:outer membrane protein assembly factor BamB